MILGIIGLGTLGEYYLRDFVKSKVQAICFKNSSYNSTIKKSRLIKKKYNITLKPSKNFKNFFKNQFDTVLICSPSKYHLKHIEKTLQFKKNIIIEKPIISLSKEKNQNWVKNKFRKILDSDVKIFYNLINEYYGKKYNELLKKKNFKFKKFKFIFHTNGKNKYDDILDDLLPHVFSILDSIYDYRKIVNIKKKVSKYKSKVQFYADNCLCDIEFLQNSKKKKLKFGFDGFLAERKVLEKNQNLSIYLECKKINKRIKISNPLYVSVKKIIRNFYNYDKEKEYNRIYNNFNKCCKIFYAK